MLHVVTLTCSLRDSFLEFHELDELSQAHEDGDTLVVCALQGDAASAEGARSACELTHNSNDGRLEETLAQPWIQAMAIVVWSSDFIVSSMW